jgi:hypothetical protein
MKKAAVAEAAELAIEESRDGRSVVIMFPTFSVWNHELGHIYLLPDDVFVRFSHIHSGLHALRVDTVVIVNPEQCDDVGLEYAKRMVRLSKEPRFLYVREINGTT